MGIESFWAGAERRWTLLGELSFLVKDDGRKSKI